MPLKLNIGLSKKIGLADYGSLGASCHVEVELAGELLQHDLETFHNHVRRAYAACRQAVQEELARQDASNGNHHAANNNGNGNSTGQSRRRDNTRPATASQVRAIESIAKRQQLDLVAVLTDRYGVRTADALSITEASDLIDSLKSTGNGRGRGAAA